jgi:hypothetical protein
LYAFLIHLVHACCMSHPSHTTWFDHVYNICWSIQVMKFLIMQSSPYTKDWYCPGPIQAQ